MKGSSYGIDVRVRIVPTYAGESDQRSTLNNAFLTDKLSETFEADIEDVTISSTLRRECSSFQITLAARPVTVPVDGVGLMQFEDWAEVIRPQALIAIAIHRQGSPSDPSTTWAPEPMFLGLVDPGGVSKRMDFSRAQPRRVVCISGRSLASVLSDQRWWYHHYLADSPPPDIAEFFADTAGVEPADLDAETQIRDLGFFAVDLNLFTDVVNRSPVDGMKAAYDFFIGGDPADGPPTEGFIKLRFADGRGIRERLRFDAALARRSFFDSGARLTRQTIITSDLVQANCWEAMQSFAEEPFVEMFTDTFGDSLEDAHVDIIVRKPPFAGHIAYPPKGASVEFSSGKAPVPLSSLFDQEFGGWGQRVAIVDNGELHGSWNECDQTVLIDPSDILAAPNLRRGGTEIYNAFSICPQIGGAGGQSKGEQLLSRETPPIIDKNPESPSYIRRYGIRLHPARYTKYIPMLESDGVTRLPSGGWARHSAAYGALLHAWNKWNPEFFTGQLVVQGRTSLRIGRRLVYRDPSAGTHQEFYITGVLHRATLGDRPSYTTTVQVERGWAVR